MDAETLAQVEELATLQFSMEEVAVIIDKPVGELSEGDPMRAYLRGRLKAQADVRRSIVSMAKQGSAQAHKQFLELAEESRPEIDHDQEEPEK